MSSERTTTDKTADRPSRTKRDTASQRPSGTRRASGSRRTSGTRRSTDTPRPAAETPRPSTDAPKKEGVAPFVRPAGRWARLWRRRRQLHQGFVPLAPQREKRRHRILPRTVIGISTMFLAFGVGAAFSGAAFYAYYDDRLAQNEAQIAAFVDGFEAEFADAAETLQALSDDAALQIEQELAPLGDWSADANGVVGLPTTVGESVWLVETFDDAGVPVVGSAFAVTGHDGGTALVTSLSVVRSATVAPAPSITLVKGDQRVGATLHTWDEGNDLALLVTDAEVVPLTLATEAQLRDAVGRRVFVVGGLGGQGATAVPGSYVDVSDLGLQHTVPVGSAFAGGPLITGDGVVLGVASLAYRPLGVDPGDVAQAPAATAICGAVLACG